MGFRMSMFRGGMGAGLLLLCGVLLMAQGNGRINWWHVLEYSPADPYWQGVNLHRLIITLEEGRSLKDVAEFIRKWGLSGPVDSSMFPEAQKFYVFTVPYPTVSYVQQIVQDAFLNYQGVIKGVEPEVIITVRGCTPNDPAWTLPNSFVYHWGPWLIRADSAWCYVTGGSDQLIAVIDDAIDYWHEDIYPLVRYGYDFADNDGNPYPPSSADAHGTHVTGIITAVRDNGQGLAGVVNDTVFFAKVMPDAWSGTGSLSTTAIVDALNAIAGIARVTVVNMSLGSSSYSSTLYAAIQNAYNNGKLLVAASGNDGLNSISYPAAFPEVIAVGSVDYDSSTSTISLSSFSNYGPEQELVAPGGYLDNFYPIISTVPYDSQYNWMAGTSMAAPHVTGVAALLFAAHPCMTRDIARAILDTTAQDLGPAGWDQFYGYGLVRADRAVLAALPVKFDTPVLVNPSCAGSCDGKIVARIDTPWNGIQPLSIVWNDGVTGTLVRNNLCAGTYVVTITDATGCTFSDTFVLIDPAPLTVSGTATDPQCYGDSSGAITLSVSGGTPPYTYQWSTGDTTQNLTGVPAGTYTVTVTDANGCTASQTFTLTDPPQIIVSSTAVNPLCYGDSTGSIDLTVTGGNPPYTYQWSTGTTTQDLTGVPADTYTVVITDASGCSVSHTVILTDPAPITVAAAVTDPLCNGDSSGSIDITVSGGTPPYTYSWSNGYTTQDLNGIGAGTYIVTVTDANGCVAADTFVLTDPDPLSASSIVEPAGCVEDSLLNVTLAVSGGTPPYTVQWSSGDTGLQLSGVPWQPYSYVITDANGCTLEGVINLPSGLVPLQIDTAIIVHPPCPGVATGSITLYVSGGVYPYTYQWNIGYTDSVITGLPGGTYTVVVTDNAGCQRTATYTLIPADTLYGYIVQVTQPTGNTCNGSVEVSAVGGTPPYSCYWNTGVTGCTVYNMCAGTYQCVIQDVKGCSDTVTVVIERVLAFEDVELGNDVIIRLIENELLVENLLDVPVRLYLFDLNGRMYDSRVLSSGARTVISAGNTPYGIASVLVTTFDGTKVKSKTFIWQK